MKCPLCGSETAFRTRLDEEGRATREIGWHAQPDGKGCWSPGLTLGTAHAVGRMLEEDPGLPLRAHP